MRTEKVGLIEVRKGNKSQRILTLFLSCLLILLPLQNPLKAQTESTDMPVSENKFDKKFLLKFKYDFKEVFLSPKNWHGRDFITFSVILGTGAVVYALDQDLYDWVQERRSSASIDVSPYISKFGNGVYLAGLIAGLYASGEIFHKDSLRRTALLSMESFLITGVLVTGLKFIAGRARPDAQETAHHFHPFSLKSRYLSFPSGDAASAFAVATTIAEQSHKIYVDILAYGLASLVAFYRVHDRKHWPSDVFFGSALGYFIAKKICRLNQIKNSEKLSISFELTGKSQSFTLSFYF